MSFLFVGGEAAGKLNNLYHASKAAVLQAAGVIFRLLPV